MLVTALKASSGWQDIVESRSFTNAFCINGCFDLTCRTPKGVLQSGSPGSCPKIVLSPQICGPLTWTQHKVSLLITSQSHLLQAIMTNHFLAVLLPSTNPETHRYNPCCQVVRRGMSFVRRWQCFQWLPALRLILTAIILLYVEHSNQAITALNNIQAISFSEKYLVEKPLNPKGWTTVNLRLYPGMQDYSFDIHPSPHLLGPDSCGQHLLVHTAPDGFQRSTPQWRQVSGETPGFAIDDYRHHGYSESLLILDAGAIW